MQDQSEDVIELCSFTEGGEDSSISLISRESSFVIPIGVARRSIGCSSVIFSVRISLINFFILCVPRRSSGTGSVRLKR